jgi:hypothetical protein
MPPPAPPGLRCVGRLVPPPLTKRLEHAPKWQRVQARRPEAPPKEINPMKLNDAKELAREDSSSERRASRRSRDG